ncbi:MAG: hypothetical protein AUK03_16020 [Anaerolineae bacterium CG2_30_64_16]|nr:MAG: hypothetical protein AUK03_16020 [Anaerolineae bacterium CG2_30_64_16]
MRTPIQSTRPDYRDFRDDAWVSGVFRPLLTAVLAIGLVAGPLSAYRVIAPWRLGYVLPLTFVAALEGVYSTRQLGRPNWRDRRGLAFRVGEVVVLLGVLRLATWLFSLGVPGPETLRLWLVNPGAFFDAQFVIVGVLLILAWGLAIGVTSDFLDLALQADEVAAHESAARGAAGSELRAFLSPARADIVGRFAARWIWGGMAVVFFATLSQLSVTGGTAGGPLKVGLSRLGLSFESLAALIGYFLAGLLLMSQARLAVLRGRWYNQGLAVAPTVLQRWHVNSALALLLVAGVAALLPMASTGWLSTALYGLIGFLARVVYGILMALMWLLAAILFPLRFFTTRGQPEPMAPPMEIPSQAEAVSRLPAWLGGAVLWIVVALIGGYFLLSYLRAHGLLQGRWGRWLTQLRDWWRARWTRLTIAAGAITSVIRNRPRRSRHQAGDGIVEVPRWRWGSLPPRERIRYFYLRTVRRAAERGLARPPHKTPLEFAGDLEASWPDAEEDVRELTAAFLAARYTPGDIPLADARAAQPVWRRIMRALRERPDAGRRQVDERPRIDDHVGNPPTT